MSIYGKGPQQRRNGLNLDTFLLHTLWHKESVRTVVFVNEGSREYGWLWSKFPEKSLLIVALPHYKCLLAGREKDSSGLCVLGCRYK